MAVMATLVPEGVIVVVAGFKETPEDNIERELEAIMVHPGLNPSMISKRCR